MNIQDELDALPPKPKPLVRGTHWDSNDLLFYQLEWRIKLTGSIEARLAIAERLLARMVAKMDSSGHLYACDTKHFDESVGCNCGADDARAYLAKRKEEA